MASRQRGWRCGSSRQTHSQARWDGAEPEMRVDRMTEKGRAPGKSCGAQKGSYRVVMSRAGVGRMKK